jgi:outer membrane receptor for Fe3+-dicitrate
VRRFALQFAGPALATAAMIASAQAEEIVVIGPSPIGFKASVLDADELDRIGAQAPSEALNRFAGVNVQRNNGLENLPAIRSPVLTGGQSAGSFLVLEDGVPIRAAGFSNVNQLWETSLDFATSLELVRGPGGAAYGANAVHGLLDVRTPRALTPPSIALEFGGFGRASAVMRQTLPQEAPQNAATVFGLALETDAGYRAQSGLDRQALLMRHEDRLDDWDIDAAFAAQNLNQETAGFIEGENAFMNADLARSNPTPEAYRDTRLARARVTAKRDVSNWTLALTPFARFIETDLILSFFPSRAQEISRQTGAGVMARVIGDTLDFGLDLDFTRGGLSEFQTRSSVGTFTQGLHYDYVVDMTQIAAFAQTTFELADWRMVAGLRAEQINYAYDNRAPNSDVGRFRRVADREDSFDAVTPKLAASRAVWGGDVYLNLARGARPPQITDLYSLQTTQTPGQQQVETIDSIELGWRGQLFGAEIDLAAYHMDKRDSAFRNADGLTVTGAATRHQGVELSAAAPLGEAITLTGWLAFARHSYRFSDPSARLGEAIRFGDDIDTSPRWTGQVRALFAPTAAFEAELEWNVMGRYFTNAANSRRYDGHDLFTARARWRLNEHAWLSATVRNLTDAVYAERADFAFGQDRFFPGEPRNLTIGVTLK